MKKKILSVSLISLYLSSISIDIALKIFEQSFHVKEYESIPLKDQVILKNEITEMKRKLSIFNNEYAKTRIELPSMPASVSAS